MALRAVKPGETPVKKKPLTIKAAIEESERDLLVAMRDKIAREIDTGVPAAYLAPIMRQLRAVDQDIRALDAREAEEVESRAAEVEDGDFDASAV